MTLRIEEKIRVRCQQDQAEPLLADLYVFTVEAVPFPSTTDGSAYQPKDARAAEIALGQIQQNGVILWGKGQIPPWAAMLVMSRLKNPKWIAVIIDSGENALVVTSFDPALPAGTLLQPMSDNV